MYDWDRDSVFNISMNWYEDGDAPSASDRKVAWSGDPSGAPGGGEIFLFDGTSTRQLTNNNYGDGSVAISGNNMVWIASSAGAPKITFYNGSTTTIVDSLVGGTPPVPPVISGNHIAYVNNGDVYLATVK